MTNPRATLSGKYLFLHRLLVSEFPLTRIMLKGRGAKEGGETKDVERDHT